MLFFYFQVSLFNLNKLINARKYFGRYGKFVTGGRDSVTLLSHWFTVTHTQVNILWNVDFCVFNVCHRRDRRNCRFKSIYMLLLDWKSIIWIALSLSLYYLHFFCTSLILWTYNKFSPLSYEREWTEWLKIARLSLYNYLYRYYIVHI